MTSLEGHEKVEFEPGPLIVGSVLVGWAASLPLSVSSSEACTP